MLFDGEDIVSVPPYKREINTVFQKYALFPHMDVYDNIAFGLTLKKEPKDVIEQKVMRMLRLVSLEDYAHRNVTELSGGQQQRISIARAILKDAPIVIFDEATSYSDIENEHKIQLALQNLLKGKTTIMIAHRLHTIRDADKIVVFQDGTVAEQGTHQELVKKGGVYGRMWEIYTQATIGKEAV